MSAPRRTVVAAAAAAVLLPTALALAATIQVDTWNGTLAHHHKLQLNAAHTRGQAKTFANLYVNCKGANGVSGFSLQGSARLKGSKLKFTQHKAYNGQAGTLSVNLTLTPGHKASGKVSWKLPASVAASCSGKDSWHGKYALSHGG